MMVLRVELMSYWCYKFVAVSDYKSTRGSSLSSIGVDIQLCSLVITTF